MVIGGQDAVNCIETLLKWNCCYRCALRYIGLQEENVYAMCPQKIQHYVHQKYGVGQASKRDGVDESCDSTKSNAEFDSCVACVGILQTKFCSNKFTQRIVEEKRKQDHDASTYFLQLSFPVTTMLRHHSISVALSQEFPDLYQKDMLESVITLKEVWRWVNLDDLSAALDLQHDKDSAMHIMLTFKHSQAQKECHFLYETNSEQFKRRKNAPSVFNLSNVKNAIHKMSPEKFQQYYQTPPSAKHQTCEDALIVLNHESIYFAGRYNKYSRNLSQSEWLIEGEKKTITSIEELLGSPLQAHLRADKIVFTASGREDVDVKMLGTGRPFSIEVVNPRVTRCTAAQIRTIQQEINGSSKEVQVRYLQLVERESLSAIKDGEMDKMKCYSAVCCSKRVITEQDLKRLDACRELQLQQKTPIRVLHRRSLATRLKMVNSIECKRLDEYHFMLYMNTQAGTYIKEFVHGDMGRTVPSISSLLSTDCDILELNVEAVLLDWPEPIDMEDTVTNTEATG